MPNFASVFPVVLPLRFAVTWDSERSLEGDATWRRCGAGSTKANIMLARFTERCWMLGGVSRTIVPSKDPNTASQTSSRPNDDCATRQKLAGVHMGATFWKLKSKKRAKCEA